MNPGPRNRNWSSSTWNTEGYTRRGAEESHICSQVHRFRKLVQPMGPSRRGGIGPRRCSVRFLPIGNTLANDEAPLNLCGAPLNSLLPAAVSQRRATGSTVPFPLPLRCPNDNSQRPMKTIDMLHTHPQSSAVNTDVLAECIDACFECTQRCSACADACLAEDARSSLVDCIRTNLDCADTCNATGRILSRVGRSAPARIRTQVQACLEACRTCEEHCQNHANEHEHCQVCADACRRCKEACKDLMEALDDFPSA